MPSDYGYINARIRGQHSHLLKQGAYEELLALPGYQSLEKWMESSSYARQWQMATARYQGLEALEWSLEKNFCQTTEMLLKIAEGQPRQLIGIILRRWDLSNLIAVARGIHGGWSSVEILKSILPAGSISEVKLQALANQPDLAGLTDTLYVWGDDFYQPFKQSQEEYQKDKDLVPVELALYKSYYHMVRKKLPLLGKNSQVLKDIFEREIDFLNAKALMRLKGRTGIDAAAIAKHYLPGGKQFTKADFRNFFDPKGGPVMLKALKGTIYHPFLSGSGKEKGSEENLEQAHFQALARLYQGDPLGISLVLGFLWQKYFEVINLRLLARGKFYGIPAGQIFGELKLF
jgi:V/A-type H+/Na+-transporting ATPase subunit C